jgi:hypothetical protein
MDGARFDWRRLTSHLHDLIANVSIMSGCSASDTCGICCYPTWIITTSFKRTYHLRKTRQLCALCTQSDASKRGLSSADCITNMSGFDLR